MTPKAFIRASRAHALQKAKEARGDRVVATIKYTASWNGQKIGTRKSHRTYTHAVVAQADEAVARRAAYDYQATEVDRKNFDYYASVAKRQVGERHEIYGAYTAEEIEEGKAKIEGGFDAYVGRLRDNAIAFFEKAKAAGGFQPFVMCWCGRLDLAQKQAASGDWVGERSARRVLGIVTADVEG